MLQCIICSKSINLSNRKICSSCSVANRRFKLKEKCVEYKGGACMKCGYNKCMQALTFHHRNPNEKLFQISGNFSKSWTKIKEELDKCDLLCSNCHHETHAHEHMESNQSKIDKWNNYQINKAKLQEIRCAYCNNNFKPKKSNQKYCSLTCSNNNKRKIKIRPLVKDLINMVNNIGFVQTGKHFGVSDKTIKKWINSA